MAHHRLKIQPAYLVAKIDGDKPFEIRYNDRGYQSGDTVEYVPVPSYESSATPKIYEITYVTNFEQKENWVVFGDRLINERG